MFWDWLYSVDCFYDLSNLFNLSKFHPFLLLTTSVLYALTTICLFRGHLDSFQVLTTTDVAVINICVWIFCVDILFLFIRSGDVKSQSVYMFKVLKTEPVSRSGCIVFHFHHECSRVPVAPQPLQFLIFSVYFILAMLMGMQWISLSQYFPDG